jgi:hypothetical protein
LTGKPSITFECSFINVSVWAGLFLWCFGCLLFGLLAVVFAVGFFVRWALAELALGSGLWLLSFSPLNIFRREWQSKRWYLNPHEARL